MLRKLEMGHSVGGLYYELVALRNVAASEQAAVVEAEVSRIDDCFVAVGNLELRRA